MNPEACYEIDSLIEVSDSFLPKINFEYIYRSPVPEEKAKEISNGPFRDLLTKIDDQLCSNSNPNFLVGNSMTTADVAFGAYTLKLVNNELHPHRQIYSEELNNFPKVKQWAINTIAHAFSLWFKSEPESDA